jgi:L-iditol 2-dehydrogenase
MRAALLHGPRDIRIEEKQQPVPRSGEVLMKVRACSVCGSDVRIFNFGNDRVKYPAIIGHEIAGEVVEIGKGVKGIKPGDLIAVGADVPSMEDDWGKTGIGNLSNINYAIGYQFPGGFAQYCLLNELTVRFGPVTRIPSNMSVEEACLAEPLACCINGLERCFMAPGKTILVIGAGPVGILLALTATAFGAGLVVLIDVDGRRVALAKQLGLNNVFSSEMVSVEDFDSWFEKDRQGFDIVLTACSNPAAQEQAIKLVSKRGVVNFFGGLPETERKIEVHSNTIHYKEAYLTGSHGSTPIQHKMAVNMIANGQVQVHPLISYRFSIDEIEKAFAAAEERLGFKVVVKPWE